VTDVISTCISVLVATKEYQTPSDIPALQLEAVGISPLQVVPEIHGFPTVREVAVPQEILVALGEHPPPAIKFADNNRPIQNVKNFKFIYSITE
jgi:hypothetical protein